MMAGKEWEVVWVEPSEDNPSGWCIFHRNAASASAWVTPGNRLHLESQNIPADVLFELLKTWKEES
jgi:hypothetical protein